MSVPRYKRVYKPKNPEYPLRPDGSLLCGPGCFSSINVLKKRFESRRAAERYLDQHPEWKFEMTTYLCEYCQGAHLTGKDSKR